MIAKRKLLNKMRRVFIDNPELGPTSKLRKVQEAVNKIATQNPLSTVDWPIKTKG